MLPRPPVGKSLCLALLLLVSPGPGAAGQATREVMADAMARMMEAMGLFDSAPAQRGLDGASPGWGRAFGAPWSGPAQDRSRALPMRELMRQFMGQMMPPSESGGRSSTWEPSRLEGIWEGRDGELLIVQGQRFRIYSLEVRRMDGLIRIQGDRLALYSPLDGQAQPFEFAERQGRLILRGLGGKLYLYRRLRLDGGWE